MKKIQTIFIFSVCAVSLIGAIASGQEAGQGNYLLKLKSPEFAVRAEAVNAVYKLKASDRDASLINQLIETYKMEIERNQQRLRYFGQPGKFEDIVPVDIQYTNTLEFAHYYLKISEIIAETKRLDMLPIFIERVLSPEVLINYGDLAIDPVITVLENDENVSRRMGALQVLKSFYTFSGSSYIPSDPAKQKILSALMKTAEEDGDGPIRAFAVRFIGKHGDVSVIPFLEKLAATDTYEYDRKTEAGTIEKVYPVRNAATKALEEVKNKQKYP